MTDRREQILSRLFAVLQTNLVQCVRNRAELPDEARPAGILLDGDESANESAFNRGRLVGPNLVSLQPEIYLVLNSRKPDNVNVGQDLNVLRAVVVKAILSDAQLLSLVGPNGEMQYKGCVTDLARGRGMDGEMGLNMTFIYVFNPNEL